MQEDRTPGRLDTGPLPFRLESEGGAVSMLEERLEAGEHALLCEIMVTRSYLAAVVDGVTSRLAKIHPLSCQFGGAVQRAAAAAGMGQLDASFDPVADALSDRVGVTALYDLADRLERALPDNCDCREHGCADLAGIPAGRAD